MRVVTPISGEPSTRVPPPHDLDAERSLLGAMLLTQEAVSTARAALAPGDFYGPMHACVFAAVCAIDDQGERVDAVGVADQLRRDGLYERHTGADMNEWISAAAPYAAARHARIVAECAELRRLAALGHELKERALNREEPAKLQAWLQEAWPEPSTTGARSWAPVDLGPVLAGESAAEPPSFLRRTDGTGLIYRGKVHAFNAESEAGKTWAALALCAERLEAGEAAAFLDFEDEAVGIIERLRGLGVEPGVLLERFVYVRPDDPFDSAAQGAMEALMAQRRPSVVVIDGVTELMVANGWSILDNDDIARFYAAIPRRLARAGAAVVLIDHVPKDKDAHGRHAIGGQHKLAGIDGAAYKFEVVRPFGRGLAGAARITVTKDRPGHVRPAAVAGRFMGELRMLSSKDGTVSIVIDAGRAEKPFKPTHLMEHLSRALEAAGDDVLSVNQVLEVTTGNRETRILALKLLVEEGYVERQKKGQAFHHRSLKPFRAPAEEEGF